jgi:hypothetical protein
MSGKVPPSSRADRARAFARARSGSVRKAAALYEAFTGHDPEEIGFVPAPEAPEAVAVIGECDFIGYTTVRDGALEKYIHTFAKNDKPLLCVDPDGRQLLLVGGRYVFTERGIVDLSDTKNLPAELRNRIRR